jgi:hypothetical protein
MLEIKIKLLKSYQNIKLRSLLDRIQFRIQ